MRALSLALAGLVTLSSTGCTLESKEEETAMGTLASATTDAATEATAEATDVPDETEKRPETEAPPETETDFVTEPVTEEETTAEEETETVTPIDFEITESNRHVVGYIGTLDWGLLGLSLVQYLPAGFCLCWCYKRSGNILSPILMHMLVNGAGVFAMLR